MRTSYGFVPYALRTRQKRHQLSLNEHGLFSSEEETMVSMSGGSSVRQPDIPASPQAAAEEPCFRTTPDASRLPRAEISRRSTLLRHTRPPSADRPSWCSPCVKNPEAGDGM